MAKRKSITGLKRKRKRSVAPVKQNDGRESALDASSGSHSITTATQSPLENLRTDRVARAEPARIGSKRSRIEVEDDVDLSYYQLHKDLVLLKPRLRYIHQDVIKRNWRVLPEAVQSRVRELLVAVQRPVICRHREGKSREEAQEALNTVTRTLAKRLPRMPFPMKTKEEHFDYERLLNKNLSLEHQLTPAIHSIALLEGQIVKEEALLAKETIALQELNRNARAEETLRNRLATKRPEILQPDTVQQDIEDDPASIGLTSAPSRKPPSLDIILDSSLQPLVLQLQSHLDSMESNTDGFTEIGKALSGTTAVLGSSVLKPLSSPLL